LKDPAVYRRNPGIRFRLVGGEAVVVHQDTSEVLVLNPTGARILELLESDLSVARLVDLLGGELEVSRDELAQDTAKFLEELEEAGIITGGPAGPEAS
jgi:hypothetical protein